MSFFENRPVGENDIEREGQGRPFFSGIDADFNISHSGGIIAVSYALGKGRRVGCDIEIIRRRSGALQIAKDYFYPAENEYLFAEGGIAESRGNFDETRFFEIWTLKESFLKLRGLSVFDMKQSPCFVKERELVFCGEAPLLFRLFELSAKEWGRCILAAVIEGERVFPEIRWFSADSLSVDRVIDMN